MLNTLIQRRYNPVSTTAIAAIFPGYYLWTHNRKMEAISVAVAAYFGYLILVGFFVTFTMMMLTWRYTRKNNRQFGYQVITEKETSWLNGLGMVGGIFGHPFYLAFIYFWLISRGFSKYVEPDRIQINSAIFMLMLSLIFVLRGLLFTYIIKVKYKLKETAMISSLNLFSHQHAILTPFAFLSLFLLFPQDETIVTDFVLPILFILSFILGSRVLYNQVKSIQSFKH